MYSAPRSPAEILGQERDELLDGDVAGIVEGDAGDVHLLVVAEEHVDHASGGRGFLLEAHEEIEDLLGPGAPVQMSPSWTRWVLPPVQWRSASMRPTCGWARMKTKRS